MLEQYVKNFARDHLGISSEYLDKIEPDEGLYVISINDTLLCTIEEQDALSNPRFSMTVALGNADQPKSFLEKLSNWFVRLRMTPWNGPARLIVASEEFTAGLNAVIDTDLVLDDQNHFNFLLDSFMKSALFVSSDGTNASELILPLTREDSSDVFQRLLSSVGIDEVTLYENLNRFMLKEDFGMVLDYNPQSAYVLISNSFDISISDQKLLELLASNPALPEALSFNYEQGSVYLQQALNLKKTDENSFKQALQLQEKLAYELKQELDAGDRADPVEVVLTSELYRNLKFV